MHGDNGAGPSSGWTRQQDKKLEVLSVALHQRWDLIASHFPGKTPEQLRARFEYTLAEVKRILEAPDFETPPEWDDPRPAPAALARVEMATGGEIPVVEGTTGTRRMRGSKVKKATPSLKTRKPAQAWTEEEHRRFLRGMKTLGKADFRRLSEEFVTNKTSSQIASHHQKYVIRTEKRRRNEVKRPSIHDMPDDEEDEAHTALLGVPVTDRMIIAAADRNGEPAAAVAAQVETGAHESAVEDDLGTLAPQIGS